MKATILPSLLALLALPLASRADTLITGAVTPQDLASIGSDLQSRITLQQTDGSGTALQSRNLSPTNQRTPAQSFTWNSADAFSGVGFLLGDTTTYAASQDYELRIYSVAAVSNGSAVGTQVADFTFTLDPASVVAGHYLYLSFPTAVALTQGGAYLLQLVPTGTASNILNLASTQGTGSGSDKLAAGSGMLFASTDAPTTLQSLGWDYALFMEAAPVPEPGAAALLTFGGLAGGLALAAARRCRQAA